jgi:hypothetical protein
MAAAARAAARLPQGAAAARPRRRGRGWRSTTPKWRRPRAAAARAASAPSAAA